MSSRYLRREVAGRTVENNSARPQARLQLEFAVVGTAKSIHAVQRQEHIVQQEQS